jgi:hypothetical protein
LNYLTANQQTALKMSLQQSIYNTVNAALGAAATGLNVTVAGLVQTVIAPTPTVSATYIVAVNNPTTNAAALATAVSSQAALASIVSNVGSATGVVITAQFPMVVVLSPTARPTANPTGPSLYPTFSPTSTPTLEVSVCFIDITYILLVALCLCLYLCC